MRLTVSRAVLGDPRLQLTSLAVGDDPGSEGRAHLGRVGGLGQHGRFGLDTLVRDDGLESALQAVTLFLSGRMESPSQPSVSASQRAAPPCPSLPSPPFASRCPPPLPSPAPRLFTRPSSSPPPHPIQSALQLTFNSSWSTGPLSNSSGTSTSYPCPAHSSASNLAFGYTPNKSETNTILSTLPSLFPSLGGET